MPSRRLALASIGGAMGALVGGCGFTLKRAPELRFRSVQLSGFGRNSPIAKDLRMNIDGSPTTKVVESAGEAQVVLEALADAREKSVVASNAIGQVTEFQLRSRFRFRLRTAAGRELIGPTEIAQSRDMSFTESAALGKEQEEATLYRAMEQDIVSQVMRRLASVQP